MGTQKIMEKIVHGSGMLTLQRSISAARTAFTKVQFEENEMFVAGTKVMQNFQQLIDYGKWQEQDIEVKRIGLLSLDKEKKIYHCPKCNYEVTRSQKYCGTCGEKVPRYIFNSGM